MLGHLSRAVMAALTVLIGFFIGAALAYGFTHKHYWHSPNHVFGGFVDPALTARQLAMVRTIRDHCIQAGWVGAGIATVLVILTLVSQRRAATRTRSVAQSVS